MTKLLTDRADADFPATLDHAARDEQAQLWYDLFEARRNAHNTERSMQCENVAYRIVSLARLVGATPWGEVQVDLLRDGIYERLLTEAGLDYDPIDWSQVAATEAAISRGLS